MEAPKTRLRTLWSFARPHRRTLALGLLLALFGSVTALATPMVTKWVLDSLAARGSMTGPVLAMVVLLVVGVGFWLWEWTLLGTLGERVVLRARESMVRRYFRATVQAVTGRPTGELVTRVTSDTLLLKEAATSSVIGLVNAVVMLVGTLALMAVLDLVLLATTVASVVVVVVLFAVLMPAIATAKERAQRHMGALGGTLESALRAIRTVKVSRAEDRQADRVLADAREATRYGVQAVRREAVAWSVAWTGIQVAIILILGVGAWRVSEGALEVSGLIAFLLYAFGLMEPIMGLSQNMTALQDGVAAAGRIREVQVLPVEPRTAEPLTASADPGGPVLELRGVTAGYLPGSTPVVRGVDLAVPRTGHTAIVGPSGAGKTTLFSLALRFLEPRSGDLRLDGVPYAQLTPAQVRARIAYVEQETPIIPGTIRDNLRYSHPDATDAELTAVLDEVRLTDKIGELPAGLDTELTTTALSGGQRQRIALARAILRTPAILLLDEATAQVDGLTEAAIHDCIRDRARTSSVITIAHRLSTVVDADRIVVLADGRVRATGTHAELLAKDDLYRDLVHSLYVPKVPVG